MNQTTEAFSRVKIDALFKDAGWNLTDGVSVLFEHALPDGSRADYALCGRSGRPLAAVEAKRTGVNPVAAQDQGRHYAEQLRVPFVFLSKGEEVWFLDRETDAHAPPSIPRTTWSGGSPPQEPPGPAPRPDRPADGRSRIACIEALSAEVSHGRRKLLVEMATGPARGNPEHDQDKRPIVFGPVRFSDGPPVGRWA